MQLICVCFTVSLYGVASMKLFTYKPGLEHIDTDYYHDKPKPAFYPRKFAKFYVNNTDKLSALGIIGGETSSIKRVPYQAAILTKDGEFLGSGAIISFKFVLTSAFLVKNYVEGLQVRVGSANSTNGGQLISVANVTIHQSFDNHYSHDLALLKLSEGVKFGDTAKPIRLAGVVPGLAASAGISGFDAVPSPIEKGPYKSAEPVELRRGTIYIMDRKSCQIYYRQCIKLDESHVCAWDRDVCSCIRDIGAPLVRVGTLLGIFEGGSYCCQGDAEPQIHTNVPYFKPWIMKHMKEQGYSILDDAGYWYEGEEDHVEDVLSLEYGAKHML